MVELVVSKVEDAGMVVLLTEVRFASDVVAVVTRVLDAGMVVLFTDVTVGKVVARLIVGVVVPVATLIGEVPVTLVTVPSFGVTQPVA
jgi:hypothetical protein